MKINVINFSNRLYDSLIMGSTVIVIDVFRCTTSIITAIMNGAIKVIPAVEPGDAAAYASRIDRSNCVLGGERGGFRMPGFDLGNSPFEYNKKAVKGKNIIISTTNGTSAICGVRSAKRVFLGAMINCSAAAERALRFSDDILIVCSGNNGDIAAEDWCSAGAIIHKIRQYMNEIELSDTAMICEHLYESVLNGAFDLSKTKHYRYLMRLGFNDDIKYCMRQDITDCVPIYENGVLQQ